MTKGSTPLGDTNEKTRMPFGVLVFLSVNLMTRGVEPERARASMRRSGGPPNSEWSEPTEWGGEGRQIARNLRLLPLAIPINLKTVGIPTVFRFSIIIYDQGVVPLSGQGA